MSIEIENKLLTKKLKTSSENWNKDRNSGLIFIFNRTKSIKPIIIPKNNKIKEQSKFHDEKKEQSKYNYLISTYQLIMVKNNPK